MSDIYSVDDEGEGRDDAASASEEREGERSNQRRRLQQRERQRRQQQLLNSPQKSVGSYVSDADDPPAAHPVQHKNLHEPPVVFNLGTKPKLLTQSQKGQRAKRPNCCEGKATNHKKCRAAIDKGNVTIDELNALLEVQNENHRDLFDVAATKINNLEKFAAAQYKDGQKIVQERNGLQDALREVAPLREEKKKLARKVTTLENALEKKKGEIETLADRNSKLTREANEAAAAGRGATKKTGSAPVVVDTLHQKEAEYEQKHRWKCAEEERKERAEDRRAERRKAEKDSRSKGVLNLVSSSQSLVGRDGTLLGALAAPFAQCRPRPFGKPPRRPFAQPVSEPPP